jgi:hypothetical protein
MLCLSSLIYLLAENPSLAFAGSNPGLVCRPDPEHIPEPATMSVRSVIRCVLAELMSCVR